MNDLDIKDRETNNVKKALKITGVIITIIGIIYAFFLYDTDSVILRISIALSFYAFSLLLWAINILIDILVKIEKNTQNRNNN